VSNVSCFFPLAVALTIVGSGPALAADLPKEGTYDITACFTRVLNRIEFSKTHRAASLEQTGTSRSNIPGGMFDNESVRCVGVTTVMEGKSTINNFCESLDKDGDKRFTRFYSAADGSILREHVAGTGKYDGLETTGTYTIVGSFPTIKEGTVLFCNRQTGTYKLK
jgi:hypothetical protein